MSQTSKRAQIFSIDLIMSAVIFIALIIITTSVFYFYSLRIEDAIVNEDLQIKSMQITDLLIKTKGAPYNWEDDPNNVNIIGLVTSDRKFSTVKLREFVKLDENTIKEKFNIEGFNFYLTLKDLNGALYGIGDGDTSEVGTKPDLTAKNIITIKRIGLYNGQKSFMEFTLWK